ncbi:hypothetical protein BC829DRAFT_447484 [Chytridium lagenaria]|nr:hypothetical protein BC829DRAFT_447484 [Chytridium lagenaria]
MSTATAQDTAAFAEQMKVRAARKGNQSLPTSAVSVCARFFMVAISAILGTVISGLIQRASTVEVSNFIFVFSINGQSGNPGAALLNVNNPCVRWFGADFPANSPIYEKNANASLLAKLDSTFVPPPNGGWVSSFANPNLKTADIQPFSRLQSKQWVIYGSRPELRGILGERPEQPLVTDVRDYFGRLATANSSYAPYTTTKRADGSYGAIRSNSTAAGGGGGGGNATPERLDSELNNRFAILLNSLAELNKTALSGSNRADIPLQIEFQSQVNKLTASCPMFGRDRRLDAAASFPTQGFRQMIQYPNLDSLSFSHDDEDERYEDSAHRLLDVLCSVIIAIVLDTLFLGTQVPAALSLWPPLPSTAPLPHQQRLLPKSLIPYTLAQIKPGDEVFTALLFMIFETIFSSLLPFTSPLSSLRLCHLAVNVKIDDEETKFEDTDVKEERDRISRGEYDHTSPLVVSHMRKDVTFAAEQGLIFGLLGPNGAGKTTLISILTGLYEASSGNATLAGFNYKSEQDSVYKVIDLTVGEHLYFYARLKGVPTREEKAAVQKALANVSLTTLENRKTKGLSGGEKRRLSIAIALIGDPAVVFLDEPTTGLDPEVRRLIWNIVTNAREGKTIILTTHSMEEAEALCQRIGIMAKGTLRCLANPIRLKDLYGSGFKLFLIRFRWRRIRKRAAAWIESLMPKGWTKVDSFATNTSYEFPPAPGVISYLFQTIEAGKVENGILDWGISQTTLRNPPYHF